MTPEDLHAADITLVAIMGVAGFFSFAMLWQIRDRKTPRWMDFLTSVMLLLFAALVLGLITDLQTLFSDNSAQERSMKNRYGLSLLIIPFFTAGLATNILSHLVLSERDYAGSDTFLQTMGKLLKTSLFILGFATVIPLVIYLACLWVRRR